MKLAFTRGNDSSFAGVIEWLIKKRTNSQFCHCELLFSDGTTFSSDLSSHGCRFTDGKQIVNDPKIWVTVDIGPMDEAALKAVCTRYNGDPYSIVGCIDFCFDLPNHGTKSFYCSEICLIVLQTQGKFTFIEPTESSPESLYDAAMGYASAAK